MTGKYALIIGNDEYIDPGLAQLTAPGKDAEDFARVLRNICAFDDVKILLNQPESAIREAIDEFFSQNKPDDLLVLYFSGHGVRDELGDLYLAVKNTNRFRLRSTAIKSYFIREAMDQSRSKRQVIILDCCNSGAFPQGTKAAPGLSIGTASAFEPGSGRIVLTASDATQFAWEGDKVIGNTQNSLFTHYLVEGLKGKADLDSDGKITVDELYDYAFDQVRVATPKQSPSKFASRQQGEIVLRQITAPSDVKSLLQENINLRKNASTIRADIRKSEQNPLGQALALVRSLLLPSITQPPDLAATRPETSVAKQILLFIFWLFVVLAALPIITSLRLGIQNIVVLFWVLVVIYGLIGTARGWRKESIILLSTITALVFNHIFRRYILFWQELPESDVSLFWLRVMILEISLYLGYQVSRLLSRRLSKAATSNYVQERLLDVGLGTLNGYLIAGTPLYYYHVANYPLPVFIDRATSPSLMTSINQMMIYMPPDLLGEPGIYFALIFVFIVVLIALA